MVFMINHVRKQLMAYNLGIIYILTMLKSRNKRIRTDYSTPASSFPHAKPPLPDTRRKSTLTHDRQSYITRTLNSINHEVNYDALSVEQIDAERNQLKLKVKEMNALINGLIAAQLGTRFDESRVSKKATISQDMGIDLPSLSRETHANSAKIEQLEDELEENLSRLAGLSNLETKVEVGRRVGEAEMRLRELRDQLGRMRKNKLLREKQIMRGNVKENEQIHHLQQEYIATTKKAENIANRIQTIDQELADSDFSLEKQKDYFEEVKAEFLLIESSDQRLQAQQDELQLAHNTRKRKLDLASKRNQKQAQAKKKKYYNMLLQYQELSARQQTLDEKTASANAKNEEALQILAKLLQHLKSLSATRPAAKSTHNYHYPPDADLFELTEPNEEPSFKNVQAVSMSSKLLVQNQLNKGNARNRSFVRKWKIEGSILHQNVTPDHRRLMDSIHQAESEEELENSSVFNSGIAHDPKQYRSSKGTRQIKHFKTENSPNRSFVRMKMEEEYEDDFES